MRWEEMPSLANTRRASDLCFQHGNAKRLELRDQSRVCSGLCAHVDQERTMFLSVIRVDTVVLVLQECPVQAGSQHLGQRWSVRGHGSRAEGLVPVR